MLVVINSDALETAFLFEGGPAVDIPYVPPTLFPVFASPNASSLSAVIGGFAPFKLVNGSRFLQQLTVGTVHAVTAENSAWGLSAGRQVTLHVVSASSNLDIGEFEDLEHYDTLAQEILLTLVAAENAPLVCRTLLPMMMGDTYRAQAGGGPCVGHAFDA